MNDNLRVYEAVRAVPTAALREIEAGRLKGKSDINPMWRIKALTEQFGPCGIGWRYEITEKRLEHGANDEIAAFVDINLYIKFGGEWSQAIPGTGGSAFVTKETRGLYTNDECFKMALTDAISVACKALGVGADVYWEKDRTKYNGSPQQTSPAQPNSPNQTPSGSQPQKNSQPPEKNTSTGNSEAANPGQIKAITAAAQKKGMSEDGLRDAMQRAFNKQDAQNLTKEEAKQFIIDLQKGS